jgi:hypothetical protein
MLEYDLSLFVCYSGFGCVPTSKQGAVWPIVSEVFARHSVFNTNFLGFLLGDAPSGAIAGIIISIISANMIVEG